MTDVFIDHFGHALGDVPATVEEAVSAGRTLSGVAALRDAGFERHHVCSRGRSAYDLAREAVSALPEELRGVGAIVYVTCLPGSGSIDDGLPPDGRDVKARMDFAGSHLQADFALDGAQVIGLNQQACAGLVGSLRLARSLLSTEPGLERVLCVAADRFPQGALYEQAYNLMSDGATACLVSRVPTGFRLLSWHGLFNGALSRVSDDEAAGTFFGYGHRAIVECVAGAGRSLSDVDWIVPQNMNRRAWGILARLLGYDPGRVAFPTLGEVGHLVCGDNLLNLDRLVEAGAIDRGDVVLLFMAGYGLNWQCALLERQ